MLGLRAFASRCTPKVVSVRTLMTRVNTTQPALSSSSISKQALLFSIGAKRYAVSSSTAVNDPLLPVGPGIEGSNHWKMERLVSLATIPLLGSLALSDSNAVIDFGLGLVLPLHVQMGFECIIDDYAPARRVGLLHPILIWASRAIAAGVVYGCFLFNTSDMGIGTFIQGLWTAKRAAA